MPVSESGTQTKILIVEDEGIVARHLGQTLQQLGYSVTGVAACAREALELAADCRPDLVLMDITIRGETDGIQLAEMLQRPLPMPVVYMTAHTDPVTLARIERTHPAGFIIKPFRVSKLQLAVDFALHRAQLQSNLLEKESRVTATIDAIQQLVSCVEQPDRPCSVEDGITAESLDLLRSQLDAAERSLARTGADLARVGYALNHDFAEPIRSVKLMCELIDRNRPDEYDEEMARTLNEVISGCTKINAELQCMRDFYETVVSAPRPPRLPA